MTATVREIPLWCGERIGASERFCGPFDRCGRCVEALGQKGCPADCPCRRPRLEPDGFMSVFSADGVFWSYQETAPGVFEAVYRVEGA